MPSAIADKVISQDQVGSDASDAFVFAPDASARWDDDDYLRTPPPCARDSIQLGCSKVCRDLQVDVDFAGSESDDLLAAARSVHLEGKTNGDARGREIAICAAVGGEIQTCIGPLVRAWPLEPSERDREGCSRFSEIAWRSPG